MIGAAVIDRRRRRAAPSVPGPGGIDIADAEGHRVHEAPAAVAESVRYLIARVQLNDPTGLPGRLALTSALSGEGVTYVARTFAAVVARDLRRRVCLVDLDWWSSSARDDARADPDDHADDVAGDERDDDTDDERDRAVALPGLADVVAGEAELDDVIETTSSPGLALVRPGRVSVSTRAALVRSVELDHVMDALAERFDHLVLELPPVLVTADALTLMRLCDTYLYVIHQGVTSERTARTALEQLSGALCLGAVLNRNSSKVPRALAGLLSG